VDFIVLEEAPYGFPHDLGDGDVASIRVFNALLQLKVKALWNKQTAISSSWHSLPLAVGCLLKILILPFFLISQSSIGYYCTIVIIKLFKEDNENCV